MGQVLRWGGGQLLQLMGGASWPGHLICREQEKGEKEKGQPDRWEGAAGAERHCLGQALPAAPLGVPGASPLHSIPQGGRGVQSGNVYNDAPK